MEVKVVLVIEAGQSLKDFVANLMNGAQAAPAKVAVATQPVKAAVPAAPAKPVPAAPAKPVPAAPAKAVPAKPVTAVAPAVADFDALDEDGQRAAIATHITRHSKKGKTQDIKALLTAFGVTRGSELDPSHLAQFNSLMEQYGAGTSVEDLLATLGESGEDLN